MLGVFCREKLEQLFFLDTRETIAIIRGTPYLGSSSVEKHRQSEIISNLPSEGENKNVTGTPTTVERSASPACSVKTCLDLVGFRRPTSLSASPVDACFNMIRQRCTLIFAS